MIKPFWTDVAKADLRAVYKFNKEVFSTNYANKIRAEILLRTEQITFEEQWQSDEIHPNNIRRIIVRHWKVTYEILSKDKVFILNVFDTRQDPSKYSTK